MQRYLDWFHSIEFLKIGFLTLAQAFLLSVFISQLSSIYLVWHCGNHIKKKFSLGSTWRWVILINGCWEYAGTTHDAILGWNNSWRLPRTAVPQVHQDHNAHRTAISPMRCNALCLAMNLLRTVHCVQVVLTQMLRCAHQAYRTHYALSTEKKQCVMGGAPLYVPPDWQRLNEDKSGDSTLKSVSEQASVVLARVHRLVVWFTSIIICGSLWGWINFFSWHRFMPAKILHRSSS